MAENPNANKGKPAYEKMAIGQDNVRAYDREIMAIARETGVDPNLLRAIMYMEISHGQYYGLSGEADFYNLSKSILPMNINHSYWGDTWGTRKELNTPSGNIRGAARYIKAVMDRYPGATISQIAELYNDIHAKRVSDYGARVQEIYDKRLWAGPGTPEAEKVLNAYGRGLLSGQGLAPLPLW